MLQTAPTDVLDTPMFFEAYYDRIHRYILSIMRDDAEADDLTQETFLRAYRQRDSLRDAGAVISQLYSIATHVCLDRLRQRARRAPLESGADLDDVDLPDPDKLSLQQTIERNEMSACVQRHLADLPDSYHAVILLHDQYGLIGPEIAETLGASLATVKIRLHRARHRLQATLEAGCAFSLDVRDSETRLRLRGLICMILLIQSADDMEAWLRKYRAAEANDSQEVDA